jgi:predicted ATPase/class 3 adenylate cyclase
LDIATWLRRLGLEQYERAFEEGDIDVDVLPDLTDADLALLGVSLGHRKKLLRAIARLRPEAVAGEGAPPASGLTAQRLSEAPGGERRQLTVLFCDLVGSTELTARTDPEDIAEIIRAYQTCCLDVIRRWEGHLGRYLGDGVLAYFGYPKAHEDDAERAVRAGLELVQAVSALSVSNTALSARVGIATGLVMAEELTGNTRDRDVFGTTPNLAARMQSLAAPGTVVISQSTRRLLGNAFSLTSLGVQSVKGFREPEQTWRVDRIRPGVAGRFEARSAGNLTPFTGRDEELRRLRHLWQLAKDGQGQVALLCGEAGIGKSRIIRALEEDLGDERYTRLRFQCSPYHVTSAWYPVIGQIEQSAGFTDEDDAAARIEKLEALLDRSGQDTDAASPLFASLLSIDAGSRYPPLGLTPQRRKARTIEALVAWLETLAARRPVLLVLEDAHWIDPTTMELFDLSIGPLGGLPVLAVVTFRPDLVSGWSDRSHVSLLHLTRLDRDQAQSMIGRLTEGEPLPAQVAGQIVSKADGVPLFIEELTKAVLETGLATEAVDGLMPGGLTVGIPTTLQDSLMARLDRLAPVKEVAQTGAVIGREFSYDVLARVSPLTEAALRDALHQLTEAEIIYEGDTTPRTSYAFKHALVRDAAYDSLLRPRRQMLHARVAQVLEEEFPAKVASEPELLAQHYAGAGLTERSIEYWIKAGRRAIERSALIEAVQHLTFGLSLLQSLPEGEHRDRKELALQSALGPALLVSKGYAAPEVETAFTRMRGLCGRLGNRRELFLALRGLWAFRFVRAELRAAMELAQELVQIAEVEHDDAFRLEAARAFGMTRLYLGDFESAALHLQRGFSLYDPEQHHAHAFRYGNDPGVVCLSYGAKALWSLGRIAEAAGCSKEALQLAHRLKHPFSEAQAEALAAMLAQHSRDLAAVLAHAESAISASTHYSFPYWLAIGTLLGGWAKIQGGGSSKDLEEIERGIAAYRSTGARLAVPWFLALQAEAHGRLGDIERGFALLAEAEALADQTGEHFYMAETHRLRGELLLLRDRSAAAEAEAVLRRALEIARHQQAKSWELRAVVSLGRLLAARGRREDALALLGPVIAWFGSGPVGVDLREARGLLAGLS